MKVTQTRDNELLIEPETDFESNWLSRFGDGKEFLAFHKRGLSTGDYLGLMVKIKEPK